MILTGAKIKEEVATRRILIDPFDPGLLNPNSYNFRLGNHLKTYVRSGPLDPRLPHLTRNHRIPDSGFVLRPNELYLGHSVESMGSSYYVPLIGGRSSTGRLGLFVHITAPLGDIGYFGQWTLQLHSTTPVRVYAGQRIGQILFVVPDGKIEPYEGKYQGGEGPQPYAPLGLLSGTRFANDPYAGMVNEYRRLARAKRASLHDEMRNNVAHLLRAAPRLDAILDVGCGMGFFLRALEERREIRRIVGIETSTILVNHCLHALTRSSVTHGDFLVWEFAPASFDALSMLAFIHLFPKPIAKHLIAKARGLLRPRGLLLISTSLHEKPAEGWERKKSSGDRWRFRVRYTMREIHSLASRRWRIVRTWRSDDIMTEGAPKKWMYLLLRKR